MAEGKTRAKDKQEMMRSCFKEKTALRVFLNLKLNYEHECVDMVNQVLTDPSLSCNKH